VVTPDTGDAAALRAPGPRPVPSVPLPATDTNGHGPRSSPTPEPLPGSEPDVHPETPSLAGRTWWTVTGVVLVLWALRLVEGVTTYPWISLAVVIVGLWGLATVAASWVPAAAHVRPGIRRTLGWATVAVAMGAFVLWSFLQVRAAPGYGTDEIAFNQYAATLALHGINPYTHSMAPSFALYHVSPNGFTFTLTGGRVTTLSYPALAFELYLPFLALGLTTQLAIGVNVAVWVLSVVLAYAFLPRHLRPAAIVIGSLSVYISYAIGGVTDAVFVPLLIGAALGWNRFVTQRGPRAWIGPALLGLAMAVKQTPWFVVPFVVTGIFLEARAISGNRGGLRTATRYLAIALVAFAVPNVPYIVANAAAWVHGILTPMSSQTVPAGQGAIGLSLFLGAGGGSLTAYTATAVVVLVTGWLLFATTYPRMRGLAFFLPSIVLFFTARSFGSYFVTLIPAALVAFATVDHSRDRLLEPLRRSWRWVAVAGALAGGGTLAYALLVSAPLQVAITGVRTTGQLATVQRVTVRVTNRSDHPVHPAFSVNTGGSLTAFWLVASGPPDLAAHHQATYVLLAPNYFAMPAITGGFQVDAFTAGPASVATSAAYLPTTWHVSLQPDAVNHLVPLGQEVTVRAAILDQLNQPVHAGGVPIYLGQIIYAQRGLIYGEAIVNGGQPGQTPVSALTDADGVATFVIEGTQRTADPVYFEGNLVNPTQFYPYGYSDILSIRFGGA